MISEFSYAGCLYEVCAIKPTSLWGVKSTLPLE